MYNCTYDYIQFAGPLAHGVWDHMSILVVLLLIVRDPSAQERTHRRTVELTFPTLGCPMARFVSIFGRPRAIQKSAAPRRGGRRPSKTWEAGIARTGWL